MSWRVFLVAPPEDPATAVVQFDCVITRTEDEARGCAMRLYREAAGRVHVRPPGWTTTMSGPALQEWLTDRLSGRVSG